MCMKASEKGETAKKHTTWNNNIDLTVDINNFSSVFPFMHSYTYIYKCWENIFYCFAVLQLTGIKLFLPWLATSTTKFHVSTQSTCICMYCETNIIRLKFSTFQIVYFLEWKLFICMFLLLLKIFLWAKYE